MYLLPKLDKRPYKARFIANSSFCTTTEISKLLNSCLTAIKAKIIKYCETVYERLGKNMFWPIKNSGEELSKPKDIGYQATSLSTYDFSTLYTTLPHNLIIEKLIDLLERTSIKRKVSYNLLVMIRKRFSLRKTIIVDITFGLVRMYVTPYRFSWTIFILGLVLSYTDKLLVYLTGTNCAPLVADLFYCAMKDLSSENQADVIKAFISTSRYLDDLLNIDNPYFEGMVNQIYPSELQLNKANTSDAEAPFFDLHLSISNGFVSSKIYDKRDNFDFDIVSFPFLDGDVPRRPSYGVYISLSS